MLDYLLYIATLICILGISVLSFNLVAGFAGMFSLAQAAFMGVGAYVSALLLVKAGLPFSLALLSATLGSCVLGALLSSVVERLRGDAFAVLTLWFAFVVTLVALNWTDVTRGAYGIAGIPRPNGFSEPFPFFLLAASSLVGVYAFLKRLVSSPFGRTGAVCRDDEEAALVLGKNVWKVRVIIFALGSAIAGFSGALFASFVRFVGPMQFGVPLLAQLLTYLMVGGLGSLNGSLLGVVVLVFLREALRFLSIDPELVGALREILLAAILVVTVMYRPRGIAGKVALD